MKKYGQFGGQYVSKQLKTRLKELESVFRQVKKDPDFKKELNDLLIHYVGRPTPLYLAKNLTKVANGAKIYLKREDLTHTGAHKINNALGQALLAKRMGKTKVIAETGAGQHGVATATACAMLNMECVIFMGEEDIVRQKPNVDKMKMLGAEIHEVKGSLKNAVDEALKYTAEHDDVFYLIGSAVGPAPYPEIVEYFQSVIGKEARKDILKVENELPAALVACVGGGSNSIGLFSPFLKDENVKIYGVEAGGLGVSTGNHASAVSSGKIARIHGMKTMVMSDAKGKPNAYSISAGLDYPAIGPKHAHLASTGRVTYDVINDDEAMSALILLLKTEGIVPAIESAHAVAYTLKIAPNFSPDQSIIVCLSGRGDKDMGIILDYFKNPTEESVM